MPYYLCYITLEKTSIMEIKNQLKNSWRKAALLLKEGAVAVIPTDTIYGICGSALNKETV